MVLGGFSGAGVGKNILRTIRHHWNSILLDVVKIFQVMQEWLSMKSANRF